MILYMKTENFQGQKDALEWRRKTQVRENKRQFRHGVVLKQIQFSGTKIKQKGVVKCIGERKKGQFIHGTV